MAVDDYNNRGYTKMLGKFLITNMRLEDITLVVPNDMEATIEEKDEDQYKWFMWTLYKALPKAFKGGQLRTKDKKSLSKKRF